jgi:hypothetical protein
MKSSDRWVGMLIKQAQRFARYGGNFAMLEFMMLTGLFDKVTNKNQ